MSKKSLSAAVTQLANISHIFSDVDMSQPFHWHAHTEGVRMALIGTYHELQSLAAMLAAQRTLDGPPQTLVQQVLGQYHRAYRELQVSFLGITDEQFDIEPAAGEWSLRTILGHIFAAERTFFTLIVSGLAQQQAGAERPFPFSEGEINRVAGSQDTFYDLIDNQPLESILQHYEKFHQRVLTELIEMSDLQFLGPSPMWWEGKEYTLQFRLHRFEAHMRQHHVQIKKTLQRFKLPKTEARQLLELVYRSLAAVENAVRGAPQLGTKRQQALADKIQERTKIVQKIVTKSRQMETAVMENDITKVQQITIDQPEVVSALGQNGLPLLMHALYQRKSAIVEVLVAAGAEPDIFAAASLGDLVRLQELVKQWPGYLNLFAKDGFTPLQLACYFNQEAAALWLIEQGADVNAVSQNQMCIAPIHAAATHGNLTILQRLLENGAAVNATQTGGYTAVHQAGHRNNVPMAKLLLKFGADPHQLDEKGISALQMAQTEGNEAVAAVLAN